MHTRATVIAENELKYHLSTALETRFVNKAIFILNEMDKRTRLTVLTIAFSTIIFHFSINEKYSTLLIIATQEFKKVAYSLCHPNPYKI